MDRELDLGLMCTCSHGGVVGADLAIGRDEHKGVGFEPDGDGALDKANVDGVLFSGGVLGELNLWAGAHLGTFIRRGFVAGLQNAGEVWGSRNLGSPGEDSWKPEGLAFSGGFFELGTFTFSAGVNETEVPRLPILRYNSSRLSNPVFLALIVGLFLSEVDRSLFILAFTRFFTIASFFATFSRPFLGTACLPVAMFV